MNVKLQEFVLLGFCDVAAAGCRALLGVDLHYHSDAEKLDQQILNHDGSRFLNLGCVSCKGETEFDNLFAPFQIINVPSKNVSLLILNCRPSSAVSGEIAHWIMDILVDSAVKQFYLLTSLDMAAATGAIIYEMCFFKEKSKAFADPPNELISSDNMFNTLIQFIHVSKVPTSCFIVNGKKAKHGPADHEELNIIQILQTLAEELTAVKFNILFSRELLYVDHEDSKDTNDKSSIYL